MDECGEARAKQLIEVENDREESDPILSPIQQAVGVAVQLITQSKENLCQNRSSN